MITDKAYCMSSFLMYRTVADEAKTFHTGWKPQLYRENYTWQPVTNGTELLQCLQTQMSRLTKDGKAALALSGGIDSALLASCMPKGSTVYTFQCVVEGKEVTNEVPRAEVYTKKCGLNQKVIPVYWQDAEKYAPLLMRHKGAPIHSIEVQIYKAALQARKDGFETLIFGESADLNYGGLSGLLSRNWTVGQFIDRYSYVLPYYALKEPVLITQPITQYEKDGYIDVHEFCRGFFLHEAMGTYTNACACAGISLATPYLHTRLAVPLDLERIRRGENKYVVREAFRRIYPDLEIPPKIPMPRPTDEWLRDWAGPVRPEFWPHCTDGMTGDQKWLVWALERFLDMLDAQG